MFAAHSTELFYAFHASFLLMWQIKIVLDHK